MTTASTSAEVKIFTDGACSGNPGPGGWGARLIHCTSSKTLDISGGSERTTNNRMELTAVIEGVKRLKRPTEIEILSDSAYIINAFKQGWIKNWLQRNWLKADKTPVENRDLWEELLEVTHPHKVTWVHVKGHAGHEHNEACDQMAREEVAKIKLCH